MKLDKTLAISILVPFTGLNVFAFTRGGLEGLVAVIADANPWVVLISVDLVISLALVSIWMFSDARARRVSAVPYLVLTALTGSIGPLLYLSRRDAPEEV